MNLIYIVMEKEKGGKCKLPVVSCHTLEAAKRIIEEMQGTYPDYAYSLYQCPYEEK